MTVKLEAGVKGDASETREGTSTDVTAGTRSGTVQLDRGSGYRSRVGSGGDGVVVGSGQAGRQGGRSITEMEHGGEREET